MKKKRGFVKLPQEQKDKFVLSYFKEMAKKGIFTAEEVEEISKNKNSPSKKRVN